MRKELNMQPNNDILHGAEAIRAFLGFPKRSQVYHHVRKGSLPHFRIGEQLCARKSTLLRWIEDQEQASLPKTGTDD
jgi:predicted DNA-binding transcriptional regulator AlpA